MRRNQWEFWLDNQISPIIAKWMQEKTGDIFKSAYILNFKESSDLEIYQKAKEAGNIVIITKDGDYLSLINHFGSPPKLMLLKKDNCDNKVLFNFILIRFTEAVKQLDKPYIHIVELE